MRTELEAARSLLTSPEWLIWLKFLRKDRRGYLQQKVNEAVEKGNIIEAQICRALMKDCLTQIELFGSFIKKTESELKKGAQDEQK